MDTLITGIQILCAACVMFGSALTMYQQFAQRRGTGRFAYAAANDFEIGYRRLRGRD
jgi:hypothetical protein